MTPDDAEPRFFPYGDGCVGVHGTALCVDGVGLIVAGSSGSGKSGLAAQLIAFGAVLVSDDIVILEARPEGIVASAPPGAPAAIELRGIGIVPMLTRTNALIRAVLTLGPSIERIPEVGLIRILACDLHHATHPPTFDLAAKVLIWMRGLCAGVDVASTDRAQITV